MLNWIRNKLREWLAEEESFATIQVRLNDEIREVAIQGAIGTALLIQHARGERLITEAQAVDKKRFWRAWRFWSKMQGQELKWEDGKEFSP